MGRGVPDDLNPSQFAQISYVLRALCMRLEAEYFLYNSGAMEQELWLRHLSVARGIVSSPVGKRWWNRQIKAEDHMFTSGFIAELHGGDRA